MHPTILVQRKARAVERIVDRAKALVQLLELDPALIEALQPTGTRDTQVLEMFRLEGLATLMDQLAKSAGVPEPAESEPVEDKPVTAVTEPEPEGQPLGETILSPGLESTATDEAAPESVTQPGEEPAPANPAPETAGELPAELVVESENPVIAQPTQPFEVPEELPKLVAEEAIPEEPETKASKKPRRPKK